MSNTKSSSCCKEVAPDPWAVVQDMLQLKQVDETPVCIHKIRPGVRAIRPEAYTPQYISLGPYHNSREDLYEMLAYKVFAFKDSQMAVCQNNKQEAFPRLRYLVDSLKNQHIIAQIRTSYDRHLNEKDDPLALVMVLDSIFLLEFLQEHVHEKGSCLWLNRTAHLVDQTESAYHSILQDIMMLENQIPIFVLNHILQLCDIAEEPDILRLMLLNTCKKLCPLKYDENNLKKEITKYAHLLELLYYLIVPDPNKRSNEEFNDGKHPKPPLETKNEQKRQRNCFQNELVSYNIKMGSTIRFLAKTRPLKVFSKVVSAAFPVGWLCKQGEEEKTRDLEMNAGGGSSSSDKEALKVEEIKIPTVSKLRNVGIDLCCSKHPITSIKFDKNTQTFHLPRITIDANTEVVIRNLVAYEAEAMSGPLVLAGYTELMSGIIDTAKDVKLLRKRNILVSYLKNDEDVAQLWNSMSRSTRLSRVQSIDNAIREVNRAYDSKRRVKFNRFTKECMVSSWRFLMLLLAIVLMVLMVIQSFCDIYNCPRTLAPVAAPPE